MPGHSTRLHGSASWPGKQRTRMQRADSLLDAISVCLNAHIHGASAFSLDDIARSIVQEIRCYKGQVLVSEGREIGYDAQTLHH